VDALRDDAEYCRRMDMGSRWLGRNPADQLLALGYSTVPALLALVGDRRLTRCTTPFWIVADRDPVARYGDVALALLSELARQSFTTREAAETWWNGIRSRDGLEPDRLYEDHELAAEAHRVAGEGPRGVRA